MKVPTNRPRGALPAMRTSDVPPAMLKTRKLKSSAVRSSKVKTSTVGRGAKRGR